jgi:hypothetical protein
MSKKMMLVSFLAASATIFALPALASGQEIHLEGVTSFAGTGSSSSLSAEKEPTFTCESTDVEGNIEPGGTTGTMALDITGCHSNLFGLTVKCRTSGSPLDNTVKTSAAFHVITYNGKPAILTTATTLKMVCAGISEVTISGNSIATITSPTCGSESRELQLKFAATGATQEDRLYTGVQYDLKLQTSGGSQLTAATVQTWTVKSTTAGKLNCT